jgi:hypothetical protein
MAQQAKFTKDYTHPISFGVEKAYKKGYEGLIPEAHYEAAKTAGAIEEAAVPAKDESKAKSRS